MTECTTDLDQDSGSDLPATTAPEPTAIDLSNFLLESVLFILYTFKKFFNKFTVCHHIITDRTIIFIDIYQINNKKLDSASASTRHACCLLVCKKLKISHPSTGY